MRNTTRRLRGLNPCEFATFRSCARISRALVVSSIPLPLPAALYYVCFSLGQFWVCFHRHCSNLPLPTPAHGNWKQVQLPRSLKKMTHWGITVGLFINKQIIFDNACGLWDICSATRQGKEPCKQNVMLKIIPGTASLALTKHDQTPLFGSCHATQQSLVTSRSLTHLQFL